MSDKIWLSEVVRRSEARRSFGVHPDKSAPRPAGFSNAEVVAVLEKNMAGEPLTADAFPKEHYFLLGGDFRKTIPPVFANSYIYLRADAVEILRQFNLGNCAFYPVKLFERDKKRLIRDDIYFLNIGNAKDTLIADLSPGLDPGYGSNGKFFIGPSPNGKLVAGKEALDGPDIWCDPKIVDTFFVSDRLAQALAVAKMKRYFFLRPCDITQ